ncbi:MAG: hypothetical protein P8R42_03765 [Candidatus Binatia bacterium]|nr:hypothetical protein [Candidatus Binatia bacterium]
MRALGVDRVEGGFVLAVLDTAGRSPEVGGPWVVPCGSEDERAGVLQAAIQQHCSTAPDAIATALEEGVVTHRLLHLPFTEPARLNATVPFELESLVPFELDEAVTTYTVLSKTSGSDLLASLTPRNALARHLQELAEANVDPAVVDVGALALAGLVALGRPDALVVEPRPGGVVALIRDGQLRGLHTLGGLDRDALAREVRWLALTLVGEDELPAVVEVAVPEDSVGAAQALGVDAVPLNQALPPWAADVHPGSLRAVALAARAAAVAPTGVNFRTGEFVYHAPSEEARRQLRQTAAVAAVTILLGLVSYGIVVAERNSELSALREEIRTTVAPIASNAPVGQERIRLEGAVQGLERRRAMLGGSSAARPPVLDVLRLINQAVPATTPFEIEELSIDAESVRFRGRTDTYESVDVIKRALHDLPGAVEPDVRDVKKGIDDRIEFRTAIEFEEGTAG